jgi:aminopeptidase-like protein
MENMMKLCTDLFPLNRSLTGKGNVQTLKYLANYLPNLVIHEFPSGFEAFDWVVPDEWSIDEAFIAELDGTKVIDFKENNLHVVGYSVPVDEIMTFTELTKHIYVHDKLEDAIPYITSYYERRFGFCLSKKQLKALHPDKKYHVVINSRHYPGSLQTGELLIEGSSQKEILLSTYICHPSMANNEISGPVVLTALVDWIYQLPNRYFTYRITFHPETLGALCFIKLRESELRNNVIAAWNFTCMGGPENFTFLPSPYGNSVADKISERVLLESEEQFHVKAYSTRGSDERQFCSPNIGLSMVSIMRSPYGEYKYYHTSKDNLDFISEENLQKSLKIMRKIIEKMEQSKYYKSNLKGEPFLHKYGLYETLNKRQGNFKSRDILNVIQFCDAKNDLDEIADRAGISRDETSKILKLLLNLKLIT